MMPQSRYARLATCSCVPATALLLGAVASATGHADEANYDARIGVFHDCLSIRNDALALPSGANPYGGATMSSVTDRRARTRIANVTS